MKWKKAGRIYIPQARFPWTVSHAANPFAQKLDNDTFRVYFTTRDADNRSHIGFLDMEFGDDCRVVKVSDEPVLGPGEPGLFDDSGVAMGYLINFNQSILLYYLGWNLKVTVPWLNTIGLAVLNPDTGKFEKYGRAPILDRSNEDPFSISYPSILEENGKLRMWYGSNLNWGSDQSEMNHVIKYAESEDGIDWKRNGEIVVGLMHEGEYAISKPVVTKREKDYEMYYSYRGRGKIQTYRIGYATSPDGLIWRRRDDEIGIDVSNKGWDSEMIEYPFVFEHRGKRCMLYNGNGYGKSGFGLAICD